MILQAKNISKSYHQAEQKLQVLKDLNLEVSSGETIAILGKSGSGKSTLLSLLCGIDRFDEGEILYADKKISTLSEDEISYLRSHHIGVIFQQFHLIDHLNALENVMLPIEIKGEDNPEQKAKQLLEKVGMAHREAHFPSELSGGEKQRVAIARALATTPRILLADEPSGSLDEKTGNEVMELIFDLVKSTDMSLILVTHDPELAKKCQRTLILEEGKLNAY
ncbi:ABC transporter ATP-binding protein [Halobacteriovorax sp. GB3]|uniref:ABC transporter ATP-binding protein n=1 Tax=Halobacteriovorax sp. GB3 TaxID=2719615 RepID=UPI00235F02FF|nr:ABC transporter ATP-binding protein [Halobacteriovorax sp. GB3]MDD0851791.1 ABC transporter ATP-binding protein [Halobacteriovorax sp. GB3]